MRFIQVDKKEVAVRKVFISYHRADSRYRHELESLLKAKGIDYYAVPENADFNGKSHESIKSFICNKLKKCDILVCLIGEETYSRPHVDREIHTALKGVPGKRHGIIGVLLPTRRDKLSSIDLNTFPVKLWDNKDYVVWTSWDKLNDSILECIKGAKRNALNPQVQTNHKNPCMLLRCGKYYDDN